MTLAYLDDEQALSMDQRDNWSALVRRRRAERPKGNTPEDWTLWLSDRYLPTHHASAFIKQVEKTSLRVSGSRRRWIGLDQPAGFGKSDLVSQWALELDGTGVVHGPRGEQFPHIPCAWVSADASMKGAGFFGTILRFYDREPAATANEAKLRSDVTTVMRNHRTRYLVIDDAHMFRLTQSRLMPDTCRSVLRLPVVPIFVGADLRNSAVLGRAPGLGAQASDQMRRRHDPVQLAGLGYGPAQHAQVFRRYISAFEQLFLTAPKTKAPALQQPALIAELHRRSDGNLGLLFECLKNAGAEAYLRDGRLQVADVEDYMPEPDDFAERAA